MAVTSRAGFQRKVRSSMRQLQNDPKKNIGGFRCEVQHLGMLGLTRERSDFPSPVAAFPCISKMRKRLRGKENRVGSKRWGVALGVGIQDGVNQSMTRCNSDRHWSQWQEASDGTDIGERTSRPDGLRDAARIAVLPADQAPTEIIGCPHIVGIARPVTRSWLSSRPCR